jgi:hypothetical protein
VSPPARLHDRSGETIFAVTSLSKLQARPDLIADAIRGRWIGIATRGKTRCSTSTIGIRRGPAA